MESKITDNTELPVRLKEMSIFRYVKVLGRCVNKQGQFNTETARQRSDEILPRGLLQSQSRYTFNVDSIYDRNKNIGFPAPLFTKPSINQHIVLKSFCIELFNRNEKCLKYE
jgi:hypothetical protein